MSKSIGRSQDKWLYCQNNSNQILSEGVKILQNSAKFHNELTLPFTPGNYLISNSDVPLYIGEARSLNKRIKQQFKKNTTTFYKNYKKMYQSLGHQEPLSISDFDIQIIETSIGTKEIEEFGIANLKTVLNKFQLNKRTSFEDKVSLENWSDTQKNHEEILLQGGKQLLECDSYYWYDSKPLPGPGIYYVEHKTYGLIYIGESSNIQDRYKTHSHDTRFSALRRHIATNILGFELKTKKDLGFDKIPNNDKKMHLTEKEDHRVSSFLEACTLKYLVVNFGRYELESHLIKKYQPLLNVKDNK